MQGRRGLSLSVRAAVVCACLSASVHAGPSPFQRGESVAPGTSAASVVTLCGLAVLLVVQEFDARAELYAGNAMEEKLRELRLDGSGEARHELADLYVPVDASCARIRSEHERSQKGLREAGAGE